MAEIFVLITAVILAMQPGQEFIRATLPIIIGTTITVVVGEIFIKSRRKASLG